LKPVSCTTFIIVFLLLLGAPAAYAHHLWITASDGEYAVMRGIHPDRIDTYDPDRIQDIDAFNKNGVSIDISRNDRVDQVRFASKEEIAMATAWSKWGYRVNTTRGKRLISRAEAEEQGLTVISAFFSNHYAKSLFMPSDTADQPTGLRFEIIPREDPVNVKPGTKVECLVLFDGSPLSGTSLFVAGGDESVTDANGRAVVIVPEEFTALLYAIHRIDMENDNMMDYEIFTTFLTFGVDK
jgi:nickel transport protein